jgi:hypothetical protein
MRRQRYAFRKSHRIVFRTRNCPLIDFVALRGECILDESLLTELQDLDGASGTAKNFLGQRVGGCHRTGSKVKRRIKHAS